MKWECRISDNFQFRVFLGIRFCLIFEWAMFCGFCIFVDDVGGLYRKTDRV